MVIDILVKRLREFFREERRLEYTEGAYGITSLLQCKKKAELRRSFPELTSESVEIDNGFMFEFFVKKILQDITPEGLFFPEFTFLISYEGVFIQPHIDVVIFGKNAVYSLEVKSLKKVQFEKFPQEDVLTHEQVKRYNPQIPEKYVKQAQFQKFFLSQHLKKKIHQLLLVSCLAVNGNNSKRVFFEYSVDDISEEEVKHHIQKWKETIPLDPSECNFCLYYPYCSTNTQQEVKNS
jgi:hypothetical protein